MNYIDIIKKRRSEYDLNNKITVNEEDILNFIKDAVKYTPSAYNSQSSRVLVLLREEHEALWDLITEEIRKVAPAEGFEKTVSKMNSFKAAYGTVLYFEDLDTVKQLQDNFPLYAETFASWSVQSNAMLQYNIWTGLANMDLGASLQHYNPIIDEAVREKYNLPTNWKLYAQMPFGGKNSEAKPYEVTNLDERVI
ncbi:MAG: nitroreductase family protein [Erysipelotrichaceae bacterium]|nr:nitroreductase family protein [Erysipelotrichaceae bacterium]